MHHPSSSSSMGASPSPLCPLMRNPPGTGDYWPIWAGPHHANESGAPTGGLMEFLVIWHDLFQKDLFGTFFGELDIYPGFWHFGFIWILGFSWFFACFGDFRHRVTGHPAFRVASHGPSPPRNRRTSCRRAPRAFRCATSGIRTVPIRSSVCDAKRDGSIR